MLAERIHREENLKSISDEIRQKGLSVYGRRYRLLDRLGTGGMGAVYLAHDRFTGQQVALKQVTAPEIALGDVDRHFMVNTMGLTDGSEDRLLLAREFRLLASLRHPNIISVLDYGFDDHQRPFYAMEVVKDPKTLLEAGHRQGLTQQIALLVQMLQALMYLHRRGVIHRDIKPSNVMVDSNRVKLLDFGISESQAKTVANITGGSQGVTGTVPYLAPELLHGHPASEASDLYAAGVMAYELIAGRHPYAGGTIPVMMAKALNEQPVLSTDDFDARLIPIVGRLLAKDPKDRYNKASDVVTDLISSMRLSISLEDAAVRDSFLQAARLVGRNDEVKLLLDRLEDAHEHRGSIVLLGGESGVGKTRLLDELRTLSMVKASLTISGQAVSTGRSPYQVWRQPLRWLCLLTEPNDEEASALKPLVPDIEELLERVVPDAQVMDPQATQKRLHGVVLGLMARLKHPLVVILEDLHWAGVESVALLTHLADHLAGLPVLLIGSYRDDESPDLPSQVSGADELKLPRLGPGSIAELAESMLGAVGKDPEVVNLLQRETEGNVFFLVEVVRALAEEAGRLDQVDGRSLPATISTGGIRKIIQRRLNRVPAQARPLLQVAAIIGRELDPDLLKAIDPDIMMADWLRACANVAVLEAFGKQWRFAHDRLREAMVLDLSPTQQRAIHRKVAVALEELYVDNDEKVAALAHHWSQAADFSDPEATGKAVDYLERSGRQALDSCANADAELAINEALRLLATLPITPERQTQEIRLQTELGGTYLMSKGHAAAEVGQAFGRARALCHQASDAKNMLPVLLGLWRHHIVRGELPTSKDLAQQLLQQTEAAADETFSVLAPYALGTTHLFLGEPSEAWEQYSRSIQRFEAMDAGARRLVSERSLHLGQHPTVASLDYGSWALWLLGYPDKSKACMDQALVLADEIGHPFSQSFARTLITWISQMRHEVEKTAVASKVSLVMANEQGFAYFLACSSLLGGWAKALQGDPTGIGQIQKVLDTLRAVGSELFRPYFLSQLAEAYGALGQPDEGMTALDEALEVAERSGEGWWEAEVYRLRGELALQLAVPDIDLAETMFLKALHRARWRHEKSSELRAALSIFKLWRDKDELHRTKARQTLQKVHDWFQEGHHIAELQTARELLQESGARAD